MLNSPALKDPASSKIIRSTLVSRNVTISSHRTSIRLEPEMWSGLSEICRREGSTLHEICTVVAAHKTETTSLTAAIRVFVMAYYRAAATEDGHSRAGHGRGMILHAAGQANHAQPTAGAERTSDSSPNYKAANRPLPSSNNRFRYR